MQSRGKQLSARQLDILDANRPAQQGGLTQAQKDAMALGAGPASRGRADLIAAAIANTKARRGPPTETLTFPEMEIAGTPPQKGEFYDPYGEEQALAFGGRTFPGIDAPVSQRDPTILARELGQSRVPAHEVDIEASGEIDTLFPGASWRGAGESQWQPEPLATSWQEAGAGAAQGDRHRKDPGFAHRVAYNLPSAHESEEYEDPGMSAWATEQVEAEPWMGDVGVWQERKEKKGKLLKERQEKEDNLLKESFNRMKVLANIKKR